MKNLVLCVYVKLFMNFIRNVLSSPIFFGFGTRYWCLY